MALTTPKKTEHTAIECFITKFALLQHFTKCIRLDDAQVYDVRRPLKSHQSFLLMFIYVRYLFTQQWNVGTMLHQNHFYTRPFYT